MGKYIVYRLDEAGRISGAEWIEAGHDLEALSRARRLAAPADSGTGGECEVWQLSRRIARVPVWSARA